MKLLFKGGRLLDPARGIDAGGDLLVADGRIAAIGTEITAADAQVISAAGQVICPGFIDLHVHLREPGQEYKEDIATGMAAAARGGFTAICCMPNTAPPLDNAALIRYVLERAATVGGCRVLPVGCISKGLEGKELAEIGEMVAAGAVAVSDDGRPVGRSDLMRLALQYSRMFDVPVLSHCEDEALAGDGVMHEGRWSAVLGLRGIPAAADDVQVARDILLAEATGGRLHLLHLSTATSVELVRAAKARGVAVTAEATPHHFTLTDAAVAETGYDTNTKMHPPLRSEDDRAAIIAGLADGTIDAIATDHAPHHTNEKAVEYDYAARGIVGLETAVALSLDRLVHGGHLSLADLVLRLSTGPARVLGIEPPALIEGAVADLSVLAPDQEVVVDPERFASKARNTPFAGWRLRGAPAATVVGGRLLMHAGELCS